MVPSILWLQLHQLRLGIHYLVGFSHCLSVSICLSLFYQTLVILDLESTLIHCYLNSLLHLQRLYFQIHILGFWVYVTWGLGWGWGIIQSSIQTWQSKLPLNSIYFTGKCQERNGSKKRPARVMEESAEGSAVSSPLQAFSLLIH